MLWGCYDLGLKSGHGFKFESSGLDSDRPAGRLPHQQGLCEAEATCLSESSCLQYDSAE